MNFLEDILYFQFHLIILVMNKKETRPDPVSEIERNLLFAVTVNGRPSTQSLSRIQTML